MTLRARLLLAAGIVLATVIVGAIVIVRTQEDILLDQVDEQLLATRPFLGIPAGISGNPPRIPQTEEVDEPISSLFVAVIEDNGALPLMTGQLLDDTPNFDGSGVSLTDSNPAEPFTVEGQSGTMRFRAVIIHDPRTDRQLIAALPLDDVDGALEQLRWTLAGVTTAVAFALALVVWWVERLGLRPLKGVTAAADSIAHGNRSLRVENASSRTEAGRLATAFNLMLDGRDDDERRLRQFVADASHELRTPITSIRGYLDLYHEGAFRDEVQLKDILRRVSAESARMQQLVEDLLLLARLDEQPALKHDSVDLNRLVRDAASDAQVVHPDRTIRVDAGDAPIEALGDEFRLQQVLLVLVTNALVHTPATATVYLSVGITPSGAELVVRDTGPGLSPDDAASVFDRFYRGDRSRSRVAGGSGLGLAIAKSIVEAHCGQIYVDTAPGHGCTFRVVLPTSGHSGS